MSYLMNHIRIVILVPTCGKTFLILIIVGLGFYGKQQVSQGPFQGNYFQNSILNLFFLNTLV